MNGSAKSAELPFRPSDGQRFAFEAGALTRTVVLNGSSTLRSRLEPKASGAGSAEAAADLLGAWWQACLAGAVPEGAERGVANGRDIRAVDLFAGTGGFMNGLSQFAAEAGRRAVCELAVDTDADALLVHARNHRTRSRVASSVTSLVDYRVRRAGALAEFVYPPALVDETVEFASADVDILLAGPPCQGHSNLNNRSRRSDRRNSLYLTVPAFAVACRARAVVIENVPAVVNDKAQVVASARTLLESSGYAVTEGVLAADAMGWPQTRRRHFLVARSMSHPSSVAPVPLDKVGKALADSPPRSVSWAIGERGPMGVDPALHGTADLSDANRARIRWLFDNDQHDLAFAERPDCHKDGTSYGAVYGRMRADQPAPTITSGFMTPGRGRFVHPGEPRTISPAEAARLQGFPVNYCFHPATARPPSRAQLVKWIGDAVPMPLGYAAALSALAPTIAASAC